MSRDRHVFDFQKIMVGCVMLALAFCLVPAFPASSVMGSYLGNLPSGYANPLGAVNMHLPFQMRTQEVSKCDDLSIHSDVFQSGILKLDPSISTTRLELRGGGNSEKATKRSSRQGNRGVPSRRGKDDSDQSSSSSSSVSG
jgi:hypothetical protein